MRMKLIAGVAALTVSGVARAMPVDQFLAKAEALQARGFTAMFSSDFKLLTSVIKADSAALKGERQAAAAAHRKPPYCPPGPVKMSSDDILTVMRGVPAPARARTDTRDALRSYFAKRFPCA
ncbi:MAG: hypothetical protein V4502_05180 [Pseudomonadota bacterium]